MIDRPDQYWTYPRTHQTYFHFDVGTMAHVLFNQSECTVGGVLKARTSGSLLLFVCPTLFFFPSRSHTKRKVVLWTSSIFFTIPVSLSLCYSLFWCWTCRQKLETFSVREGATTFLGSHAILIWIIRHTLLRSWNACPTCMKHTAKCSTCNRSVALCGHCTLPKALAFLNVRCRGFFDVRLRVCSRNSHALKWN